MYKMQKLSEIDLYIYICNGLFPPPDSDSDSDSKTDSCTLQVFPLAWIQTLIL